MFGHGRFRFQNTLLVILPVLAATQFAACAGEETETTPTMTGSSTSGQGGAGGGNQGCTKNADCVLDPDGKVLCDTETGFCVECLQGSSVDEGCEIGEFCNPATNTCEPGCNNDLDCVLDPSGKKLCNQNTGQCVECLADKDDCDIGKYCDTMTNACVDGCNNDIDCVLDPKGKTCDTNSKECVGCLASNDMCPQGQWCDPSKNECSVGCTDNSDCNVALNQLCNPQLHQCVGCVTDANCASGSICIANTCIPGCNDNQPCQPGYTCCNFTCYDLTNDEEHCGDCTTICENAPCTNVNDPNYPNCDPFPNADPLCQNGACTAGNCKGVWKDCNKDPIDGCEQNSLQDGDCLCAPGDMQACYFGSPGTENKGICKGGMQTCNPDGLSWGPCVGQVLPAFEICGNGIDEDCDSIIDNASDIDGDGWTSCNGDCCDGSTSCGDPTLVNPGAFEVLNDGIDNDCDPATSDVVPPADCSSVSKFTDVTGEDVAHAMELCQFTAPNPPLPQKKWGVVGVQQLLADGSAPNATQFANMQDWQSAIFTEYGTGGVVPKKGLTMAALGSGKTRDQNDPGFVAPNGGTGFSSNSQPPAAYLAANGGQLPSSAGCSGNCPAGSGANDSVNVKLTIRVPTNAQTFSYDFRFFSAEYWTYACSSFNDFYLALLQSASPAIPTDKNVSFDTQGNPISVNNGFFEVCVAKGCYTCPDGANELAGTGMQLANTGGGTKWLTTDVPIVPGETVSLELMIFDVSDTALDSIILLDNFRWNLAPPSCPNPPCTHE